MATIKIVQMALLVCGSLVCLLYNWRYLTNPRVHGFYRFFGWIVTLILLVYNLPFWFREPFSPAQIASWMLLLLSITLALDGFILLHMRGKPSGSFENTTAIVATGIYKYIRHPLYASLILLSLGIGLKNPTSSAWCWCSLPAFSITSRPKWKRKRISSILVRNMRNT